jgi:hypothetical protein
MTSAFATDPTPVDVAGIDGDAASRPGVGNIGPEEVARRRRAGHMGLIATARRISLANFAIGVAVAIVAVVVPL